MYAVYLFPEDISHEAKTGLLESFSYDHQIGLDLDAELASGNYKVFRVDGVYMAVSLQQREGKRVVQLDGCWVPPGARNTRLRSWINFLIQLGEAWGCSRVETAVKNPKLMRAILRAGAKVDYVALGLEINHGQ